MSDRAQRVINQYLHHYAERELALPPPHLRWDNCLVIPAFDESPQLPARLAEQARDGRRKLFIVVINHPDHAPSPQVNAPLREAAARLPLVATLNDCTRLLALSDECDLLCLDLDQQRGALAGAEGVGRARKAGADLALAWIAAGAIASPWICQTDADARLPHSYFSRLAEAPENAAAITFPFCHDEGENAAQTQAIRLYEYRLHHYVRGLEQAGSPYAMHTLGSCIAVRGSAYARVRGVPCRAGGEDFYLLNKLRKVGAVHRAGGECLRLSARASSRVPFGTGPAVMRLQHADNREHLPMYEHPACFQALGALLHSLPKLYSEEVPCRELLSHAGLPAELARATDAALQQLGFPQALSHCRQHGHSSASFMRHMHQWLDGLRSLQLIHLLRDRLYPELSWSALAASDSPQPVAPAATLEQGLARCRAHWGWTSADPADS